MSEKYQIPEELQREREALEHRHNGGTNCTGFNPECPECLYTEDMKKFLKIATKSHETVQLITVGEVKKSRNLYWLWITIGTAASLLLEHFLR